tara:strand:- start:1061 stop:1975 length:915 start_codon:yes stop_codon:yes gene_type:complete
MSDRNRIEQIDRKVANLEKSKEKIDFKISSAVDLLQDLEISAIKKLFNKVVKGEMAPFAGEYLFYDGYSKIYLTETDWKVQDNNPIAWIDFRYECDWDKDYNDPNRYGWTLKFGCNGISHHGFDPRTKDKDEVYRILSTHSAIGTLIELIADNKFDGIIDIRENYRVMRELECNNKDRKELSEAIHLLKTERREIIDTLLDTPGFQFDVVGDNNYKGEPSSRTVIGGDDFYNAHAIRIERVTPKMIEFTVVTRHQRWDGQKNEYIDAIETTEYKRFKRKENVLYALRRKYQDYFLHKKQSKQKV